MSDIIEIRDDHDWMTKLLKFITVSLDFVDLILTALSLGHKRWREVVYFVIEKWIFSGGKF